MNHYKLKRGLSLSWLSVIVRLIAAKRSGMENATANDLDGSGRKGVLP
jgi:hypothetical protein